MAQGLTDDSLKFHIMYAKKHGVTKKEFVATFTHVAFEVPGENTSTKWLEPVADEAYNKLD